MEAIRTKVKSMTAQQINDAVVMLEQRKVERGLNEDEQIAFIILLFEQESR